MELIIAMFIVGAWYAYKQHLNKKPQQQQPESEPPVVPPVEVEILERKNSARRQSCSFCQDQGYLPSPTIERMPCPKCSRDKKIS
ncbi:hypothetical protein HQN89_10820 [Paenibacillus frigoriresistens]|uniref:hypothetical protein n=1 Tax=Paenibacillus alginolyticus TaxID=59839 RepID=UPI00156604C7|nr:hypothetical protein [Paenibacillus frigoriresistens]NRF91511.1 hypothetical protein [Paenibacillus frigoriresistens]